MPLYGYTCDTCTRQADRIVAVDARDALVDCGTGCGGALIRDVEIPVVGMGRADSRFQMAAIMSDGTKVPGNFGGADVRKQAPVFTQGCAPTRAERQKHAWRARK